jgi:glycosyltransferase involved in cell wall biosynthesis
MKLISVVTPCFNEEDNILELHKQVKAIFAELKDYQYEHIFIDNASVDKTVPILKELSLTDPRVKIIVNARNFGHLRSPFYGMLQAQGDAVISLVADLQDPPSLIKEFIAKWEQGFKIAVGIKPTTQETFPMSFIRKSYYRFITRIADVPLIQNFTGFGLYDQEVIRILRGMKDAYPYFRGLIAEIGFPIAEIPYHQPRRHRGISKNNFYTLYDAAMLGITSHSKVPIRLATMAGFFLSIFSFSLAIIFFILKLFFWHQFALGLAPILIGMFFFSSAQLFFIGLLGEYIVSIHTQTLQRPLVIEKERINFASIKENA